MSETISPDATIAQYTIVSKLGEGGMGEVYRARDPKLGRDVAIKVLPASLSENVDRLNRFEQEAQAAGALNHPNILSIFHIGTHDGAPYIVSELLEGETLRERMASGALPQRKAVDYALQIAKGLAAAHEKGIVHRDIKPDNIFITDDGHVKILDFGIAKLTGNSDGTQSQTEVPTRKVNTDPGTVMGTIGYMSPEQLKGKHVDAPPGWLIFVRNDALVAQAFDAGKLAVTGEAIPIITGTKNNPGTRRFSVSENGILVWQEQWQRDYQLVWYDREGKQTGVIDAPTKVSVGQSPMLSPDGKRLVVRRVMGSGGAAGADSNLWVVDLDKGGAGLRITSTFSQMPVWSPDGSRILHNNGNNIVVRAANGSGDAETLLPRTAFPAAWSTDGRFIIFMERGVKTRMDLWALPMFGDRKEYQLTNSPFDEQDPQLSPDGRWLAYTSDETGHYEIYVRSFSSDGKLGADKTIVSTSGGKLPIWRRDGSELFFIAADGQMMASSVKTDGTEFQFAAPKPLFKTRTLSLEGAIFREYDVSPDGQRFLIGTLIGDTKAAPPTVIMNWTALLKH